MFRTALQECKAAVQAAITRVEIDGPSFDRFMEEFAGDFSSVLSNSKGRAIWRRDGRSVRHLARYIGTIAEFYAAAAVPREKVGMKHLRRALSIVQPECHLPSPAAAAMQRDYLCRHVSANWQDEDE